VILARLLSLVGGRKPTAAPAVDPDALPAEVAALLAGVSFLDRGADHDGNHRLLVTLPAGGALRFSREAIVAWMKGYNLNDAQLSRALAMLRGRLAEWQRLQETASVSRGSRWADWKPIHAVPEN
jgi:hypothetical protein